MGAWENSRPSTSLLQQTLCRFDPYHSWTKLLSWSHSGLWTRGFTTGTFKSPSAAKYLPLPLVLPPGSYSIYFNLHANKSMAKSCPFFKGCGLSHSAVWEQTPHNPLYDALWCRPKLRPGNTPTWMSTYQCPAPCAATAQTEPGCPKLGRSSHALYERITTVATIRLCMSIWNTFMSHWHIALLGKSLGFFVGGARTTTFLMKGII